MTPSDPPASDDSAAKPEETPAVALWEDIVSIFSVTGREADVEDGVVGVVVAYYHQQLHSKQQQR